MLNHVRKLCSQFDLKTALQEGVVKPLQSSRGSAEFAFYWDAVDAVRGAEAALEAYKKEIAPRLKVRASELAYFGRFQCVNSG